MVKTLERQTHTDSLRPADNFSLFVLLVDGMMGKEAQFVLTTLSRIMAAKMNEPILHVKSWVNSRIETMFIRSYPQVLYGDQVPSTLLTR